MPEPEQIVSPATIDGGSYDDDSLQPEAGRRVADIMVMLAGGAVEDPAAWAALLTEHLDGARRAMRERALEGVGPTLAERP